MPDRLSTEESASSANAPAGPPGGGHSESARQARLAFLRDQLGRDFPALASLPPFHEAEALKGHIEQFVGYAGVPVGVAGPLRLRNSLGPRSVYVPMATTEGALIASYQRGMRALTQAGGASVQVLAQRVQRAPLFRLQEVTQALQLAQWVVERLLQCQDIAAQHSRYGRLQEIRPLVEGNQLWLTFHFSTADAAGQNMVTICTEAICRWIARQAPVVIEDWYLDGNLSGDKKATHRALMDARGYRVAAESVLPPEVLQRILSVEAAQMERCWRGGVLGAIQSGANGALAHAANGLAALFLATGQDVACVAEAANGVLRMEARPDGSLYVAVTLPNLIVGSVGGGGNLPTQRDCLAMIGCHGPGHGPHLAEIAAGTVLAGEVSLTAAMAGGHFGRAHALLGRPRS